jgi:sugar lactone lactonase YvrE
MQPIRLLGAILVCSCLAPHGSAAELQYPLSIAVVDGADSFYLADRNLPGVWRFQGGALRIHHQGSKTFRTPLNAVRCVALDRDGKLLVGDSSTREVYRFGDQGQPVGLTHKPGSQSVQPPANKAGKPRPDIAFGQIGTPMDIAVGPSGDLFVSDLELHRIVKVPSAGGDPVEFVEAPTPRGLCFDSAGNLWAISGRELIKVSASGEKSTVVGDGAFEFPHTVAVSADGTAFVCDGYAKAIWKVAADGKPVKLASGPPFVNPVGMRLAVDKLLVADPHAKSVFQVTLDGKVSAIPK